MKGHLWPLVLLTLVGCSLTQTAYNRADWWALREIQRYVTLDPEQRVMTRAALSDFHQWHRDTQLPRYADALDEASDALSEPLSAEAWTSWLERLEQLLSDSLQPLPERAAPLIAQLSDAQIEEFWERFQARREARQDDREAVTAAYLEREGIKRFRRWVGRPTDTQRDLLRAWAQSMPPRQPEEEAGYRDYLVEREAALRALVDRRGEVDFAASLKAFIASAAPPLTTEDRQADERDHTMRLLAALSQSLTERQRDRLRVQVKRYASDSAILSGR